MRFFYPAKIDAEFPTALAALEDLGLSPEEAQLALDAEAILQRPELLFEVGGRTYAITQPTEDRAVRWHAYFGCGQESREEAWRAAEQLGIMLGGDQGWAIFTWNLP